MPNFICGNLRYRFIAFAVPLAVAIGGSLLFVFWLLAQNLIDDLGDRISSDQVLLDQARAALPLTRELTLAETLAGDPAIISWARQPDDSALRRNGLATLNRFRNLFNDGNYFFIPGATKEFYYADASQEPDANPVKYTLSKDNPDDAWYFSTIELPGLCYLNIDFDRALQQTKVWFNCNVRDPATGTSLGVVGSGIDLTDFINDLQKSQPVGVTTIYADSTGAIQAHPNIDLIEQDALTKPDNLKSRIFDILDSQEDSQRLAESLRRAKATPDKATTVTVSIGGRDHLIGATFMPQVNWFSISVMDLRILVFGRYFIPFAILVALAVIASLTALGIALDRIVLRRIDRLDAAVVALKEDQHLDFEPSTQTSPDQLDRLQENFREMAASVRIHTDALTAQVETRTRELQQSHDDLLTANRQKDKFFSIMAHDMISPFSTLIGVSDFLKSRADKLDLEKIVAYSADLHAAATGLYRLLENLLAWSRLQQGNIKFAPESTDLPALIRETTDILRPSVAQKSLALVLDMPANHKAIVDPHMVETILRNLLGNAIKFSEPGGSITIGLEPVDDGTWLKVSDNGVGMDAATLESLRYLGGKTPQKGTAGEMGSGLGLQICMDMVALHDGWLDIQSTPGAGSTFKAFFPTNLAKTGSGGPSVA